MFKFLKNSSETDFTQVHDDTLPINDVTTKSSRPAVSSSFAKFPAKTSAANSQTSLAGRLGTASRQDPSAKAIVKTFAFFYVLILVLSLFFMFSKIPILEDFLAEINPFKYQGDTALVLSLMDEEESAAVESISFDERQKCYLANPESKVCYIDSYSLELKNGYYSKAYAYTTDDGVEVFSEIKFTNTYDVVGRFIDALKIDDVLYSFSATDYQNEARDIVLFSNQAMKEIVDSAYFETLFTLKTATNEYLQDNTSAIDRINFIVGFRDGTFINLSTDDNFSTSTGFLLRGKTSYTYSDSDDGHSSTGSNNAMFKAGIEDYLEHQKIFTNYIRAFDELTDEFIQKIIESTYAERNRRL